MSSLTDQEIADIEKRHKADLKSVEMYGPSSPVVLEWLQLIEDRAALLSHLRSIPTAPAPEEPPNYCSACGDPLGDFAAFGCTGFDKHELGKPCPMEQFKKTGGADV